HYAQVLPLLRPDDDGKQATIFGKLGELNVAMNLYETGCDYLQRAIALWQKIQNYQFEAETRVTLGKAYNSLGNDAEAFKQFKNVATIFEKLEDQEAIGNAYVLLGATAPTQKDALDYYSRALAIWQKLGLKKDEASTLTAIASFYSSL